jgi:DNA repair exonuclease SbcCD nuclease subunit
MVDGSDNIWVYKEQLNSWKAIMKPLYDAGIPIYVIRGNHEAASI